MLKKGCFVKEMNPCHWHGLDMGFKRNREKSLRMTPKFCSRYLCWVVVLFIKRGSLGGGGFGMGGDTEISFGRIEPKSPLG